MSVNNSTFETQKFPFSDTPFQRYLFNSANYLKEYPTDELIRYVLQSKNKSLFSLTGIMRNNELMSVPWATFGGIECYSPFRYSDFDEFIERLIDNSKHNGIEGIKITLPPEVYKDVESLGGLLTSAGFVTFERNVNQHINIVQEPYPTLIAYNERKKLNKSIRQGFKFRKLDRSFLPEAYRLIEDNRVRKGFPVSMTLSALDRMFEKLPDSYHLFGVFDDSKLIAAAVSIRITDSALYNFYHGDAEDYRSFSPVVMLLDGIYSFCQTEKINVLDLGISSVQGELNEGLFRFKKNCGAEQSAKKIYYKALQY